MCGVERLFCYRFDLIKTIPVLCCSFLNFFGNANVHWLSISVAYIYMCGVAIWSLFATHSLKLSLQFVRQLTGRSG